MAFNAGSVVANVILNTDAWIDGIKTISESEQTLSQRLQNFGQSLMKNVTQPLLDMANKAVEAFQGQELAEAKLNAVLKATGYTAGQTGSQLAAMAGELQKTTGFSDDAIISAQAMMATFRNIGGDVFPRATRAMVDLAAMTGDLAGASKMLGRALEAPADASRMLRSMNVMLTDSENVLLDQLVATGKTAEAQSFILRKVEGAVGGLAEKMAQTGAGAVKNLNNSMDDLRESFGAIISKAITPIIQGFAGFIDWITSLDERIKGFIVTFLAVIAVVGPLLIIGPKVVALITAIGLAFQTALGPIALILAGIVAVTAAVVLLTGKSEAQIKAEKRLEEIREQTIMQMAKLNEQAVQGDIAARKAIENNYALAKSVLQRTLVLKKDHPVIMQLEKNLADQRKTWAEQDSANEKRLAISREQAKKELTEKVAAETKAMQEALTANAARVPAEMRADREIIAARKEVSRQTVDLLQKEQDAFKGEWTNRLNYASSIMSELSSITSQYYRNKEIEAQNNYNVEKKAIEANVKDEEQRAKQLEALDKRYAAEQAEQKRKQAESDKAYAIMRAIIETAVKVIEQFPNPVTMALAGALGAAQVAMIASQPIPSFAQGGMARPGYAVVGERGPELVKFGSPARVYSNADSKGMGGVNVVNNFNGPINSAVDIDAAMIRAGKKLQNAMRTV